MRLGIDFGTTRIVVSWVDRGNYPVVGFDAPDSAQREWFPPLVAVRGARRIYGWEAWNAQEEDGWTIVRSLKRALESAGPETLVEVGEQTIPMMQLLRELVEHLRADLLERSNLPAPESDPIEVMLGVPANANSNQRFLTAEAFRQGGFSVLGLLNEPSAASIEYGHRNRGQSREKTRILVYDLGGGTFDASLVELDERAHAVIASEGISTLGGDDFDGLLAECALEASEISSHESNNLTQAEIFRLHEECRQKKESLHPNTRQLVIDLGIARYGWEPVAVSVSDYYERCRPLVDETIHATEDLLNANGYWWAAAGTRGQEAGPRLDALYVTGGGSELPLVARMLREVFGRRVKRSAYTRSATAIGLAIQADAEAGYSLRDKFTRYFGVWREAEAGRTIVFDPLFPKGAVLPTMKDAPLESSRRYYPVHNIGHFRYLECSHLSGDRLPTGDITLWDDIRFPFDPGLQNRREINDIPVQHMTYGPLQEVEEHYACDASGAVTVNITNLSEGYSRSYRLGRWASASPPITPGVRSRKRAPKK
jgi:molecular chaperone DnaK (HSP70)